MSCRRSFWRAENGFADRQKGIKKKQERAQHSTVNPAYVFVPTLLPDREKNLSRIFITALCSFSYQTTTKLICESTNIARVLQETPVSAESFKATKDCRKAKQQRNQFQVPQKPIGNGFVLVLLFGSLEMQRHEEEKSHNNNPACVWRWWWRMCVIFLARDAKKASEKGRWKWPCLISWLDSIMTSHFFFSEPGCALRIHAQIASLMFVN